MDTMPGDIPQPPELPLTPQERTWAMVAHLSALLGYFMPPVGQIIGPLVVWLLKRDSSPFVADQAKEALNAQISVTLYAFIYLAIAIPLCLLLIGIPLLMLAAPLFFALGVADLIFIIVATVAANEGRRYRYPLILRLVK